LRDLVQKQAIHSNLIDKKRKPETDIFVLPKKLSDKVPCLHFSNIEIERFIFDSNQTLMNSHGGPRPKND